VRVFDATAVARFFPHHLVEVFDIGSVKSKHSDRVSWGFGLVECGARVLEVWRSFGWWVLFA